MRNHRGALSAVTCGPAAQAVDEDGHDALVVLGPAPGGRLGQLGDGEQQILGADVIALVGARTMDHLDSLLAGLDVALTDDILDQIDEIVAPGTDIGTLDQAYWPPALEVPSLRRRPLTARAAA